jgi:hypothetical protein
VLEAVDVARGDEAVRVEGDEDQQDRGARGDAGRHDDVQLGDQLSDALGEFFDSSTGGGWTRTDCGTNTDWSSTGRCSSCSAGVNTSKSSNRYRVTTRSR